MCDVYSSEACSVVLAAKLAGLSPRTFRSRYLETGLVKTSQPFFMSRPLVQVASLGAALGRTITYEELRRADQALEDQRRQQRRYRRQIAHQKYEEMLADERKLAAQLGNH